MIKDKLQLSKDSSFLYTKCPSCHQEDHYLLKDCQIMNYKPNKFILIGKYNYWTPVISRSLVTRRKNKISSLINKNLIKETSEVFTKVFGDDYLINNEEDDEKSKISSLTFEELQFQNGNDELNSLKLFNEEYIINEKEYFKKVNTNENIELENQKSQNSPLSSITRKKKNNEKNEICNINSETFGKLSYDFEIMKNFKNYFTIYNFEIIINKIRRKLKKKTEIVRTGKQKSGKTKLFKNKVLINSRKI